MGDVGSQTDPARSVVAVHRLGSDRYVLDREYSRDESVKSVLLPRFAVDVASLFRVADDVTK